MRKVILYIACSLDSYIARADGRVDWLFSDADYGYTEFLRGIDTIIMGRVTYDQLLTFGDYPYRGKEVFVVSRSRAGERDENVLFTGKDIIERTRKLAAGQGKGIWLVGGAHLIQLFVAEQLVDEIIVSVHPIILGAGIPLFLGQPKAIHLELREARSFPSGLVQLHYNVIREAGGK